jgi:guanylate kinase
MSIHRKTIICIVGESGSGKTYIAEHLKDKYNVPLIESRTTRAPRYEGEVGHTFVSNKEFDSYKKEDMLAFTTFGEHRYCCLKKDVTSDIMTYVIDENGLQYLRKHFSDIFNIFAIRVFADEHKRAGLVGVERIKRDKNMFTLSDNYFDAFIYNTHQGNSTKQKTDTIYSRIQELYESH